jgi:hypothetical protein
MCGQGAVCLNKVCANSSLGSNQTETCPYGDDTILQDMVWATLPARQVSCKTAFEYMTIAKESLPYYCNQVSDFNRKCCQSCKSMFLKKNKFQVGHDDFYLFIFNFKIEFRSLTCRDKYAACPEWNLNCNLSSDINDCPYTCGRCIFFFFFK